MASTTYTNPTYEDSGDDSDADDKQKDVDEPICTWPTIAGAILALVFGCAVLFGTQGGVRLGGPVSELASPPPPHWDPNSTTADAGHAGQLGQRHGDVAIVEQPVESFAGYKRCPRRANGWCSSGPKMRHAPRRVKLQCAQEKLYCLFDAVTGAFVEVSECGDLYPAHPPQCPEPSV